MKFDRTLLVALLACLLIAGTPSLVIGGVPGLTGYGIGLAAALFCVAALAGVVSLTSLSEKGLKTPLFYAVLIVLALFLKLPLYAFAAQIANDLPEPGPGCFAAAIVLVYSAAITLAYLSSKPA